MEGEIVEIMKPKLDQKLTLIAPYMYASLNDLLYVYIVHLFIQVFKWLMWLKGKENAVFAINF